MKRTADLARVRSLVDAQRVAIRHPNPRVALSLGQRVDRALKDPIDPADYQEAVGLRESLHELSGLVNTELERLKMELTHHLGTRREGTSMPQQIDRVLG